MEKYNYKKKYGQNFIKNKELLKKITEHILITEDDLVIEIGLGQGDLTRIILEKKPFFVGYEIDSDLKIYLDKLINDKTNIIFENFLDVIDFSYIKQKKYNKLYIIANLPYYITTPIINKIIKSSLNPDKMLLMVQKEVADRITAKPNCKEYGSLTVFLNYYFKITKVLNVDRSNFNPIPNVDSVVLLFEKRIIDLEAIDLKQFEKLLFNSFQFKRKIIKNNLKEYDLDIINNVLIKNNLSLNSRAEQIPLNVFVEMSNKLITK